MDHHGLETESKLPLPAFFLRGNFALIKSCISCTEYEASIITSTLE